MTVTVTLVVGADGATRKNGNSSGVSSSADRSAFLTRRRAADCILIGGATARTEPYSSTPVPVVVISRQTMNPIADNPISHLWSASPEDALDRAISVFGPNVHVEAGISIVTELISKNRVDAIELSITDVQGGEGVIDIETLLSTFPNRNKVVRDGTTFISAHK